MQNKEIIKEKNLSSAPNDNINLEEQREKYKHLLEKNNQNESSNTNKGDLEKIADKTSEVKLSSNNTTTNNKTEKSNQTQKPKFSSISIYNGDSCDLYNWSQGTTDVQIQIKLPDNTGAKKVKLNDVNYLNL